MRGLLTFSLEVSEYGIEDSISKKGVVIEVVVFSRLSVYVEALYCVKVGAFFLELYHSHDIVDVPEGV
jgi:hypothetical protein